MSPASLKDTIQAGTSRYWSESHDLWVYSNVFLWEGYSFCYVTFTAPQDLSWGPMHPQEVPEELLDIIADKVRQKITPPLEAPNTKAFVRPSVSPSEATGTPEDSQDQSRAKSRERGL